MLHLSSIARQLNTRKQETIDSPSTNAIFLCHSISTTSKYFTFIHCLSKSDRFWGVKRACFGKRTRQSIAEHKVQQRSDQGGGENSKTSQAEFECIIYEIKKAYLRWFCKSNSKKTRGEQFREVQSSQGTAKQRQQKDTSVRESLSGGIKYNPSDRATDWPAEDPWIVKNISRMLTRTLVWRSCYTLARHNKPTSTLSLRTDRSCWLTSFAQRGCSMSWSPFLFLRFGRDSGLVTAPALSSVSSVDPQKLESSASATAVLHARLCDASRTVLNPRSFTSMELFSRTQYNIVRRSSLICLLHPHSNWGPPGSSLKFRAAYIAKTTLTVVHRYWWRNSINKRIISHCNCPHLFPRCNPVLRIHEDKEATKNLKWEKGDYTNLRGMKESMNE